MFMQRTRKTQTVQNLGSSAASCSILLCRIFFNRYAQEWQHLRSCVFLMATTDVLYLGLGHILLTIQSRHFWHALWIIGAQSTYILADVSYHWCWCVYRCTSPPDDLDSGALPRTREFSDAQAENLELGEAWDAYGLVADIVVRPLAIQRCTSDDSCVIFSHSQMTSHELISMNFFRPIFFTNLSKVHSKITS